MYGKFLQNCAKRAKYTAQGDLPQPHSIIEEEATQVKRLFSEREQFFVGFRSGAVKIATTVAIGLSGDLA